MKAQRDILLDLLEGAYRHDGTLRWPTDACPLNQEVTDGRPHRVSPYYRPDQGWFRYNGNPSGGTYTLLEAAIDLLRREARI